MKEVGKEDGEEGRTGKKKTAHVSEVIRRKESEGSKGGGL